MKHFTIAGAVLALASGTPAKAVIAHPQPIQVTIEGARRSDPVWLDTVMDAARQPVDGVLTRVAARLAGYLVTESVPLPNTTRGAPLGTRTDGFANIAFLRRPERLSVAEWLDGWQNGQTPVAIETQSTFGYTQNVVVRIFVRITSAGPAKGAAYREEERD